MLPFVIRCILIISFSALLSCAKKQEDRQPPATTPANDTISLVRKSPGKLPVAKYREKVKNPYNDWWFAVSAYETGETFKYILRIEYETLNESDTIAIPNVGIVPFVQINKGDEPLSCVVGFKNKEGKFMPYKQVWVQNKQLRIKTVGYYARTLTRKK